MYNIQNNNYMEQDQRPPSNDYKSDSFMTRTFNEFPNLYMSILFIIFVIYVLLV